MININANLDRSFLEHLNIKFSGFSKTYNVYKDKVHSFSWTLFCCIRFEYDGFPLKISVFSPNANKYGPEKLRYVDFSHAVLDKKQIQTLR